MYRVKTEDVHDAKVSNFQLDQGLGKHHAFIPVLLIGPELPVLGKCSLDQQINCSLDNEHNEQNKEPK